MIFFSYKQKIQETKQNLTKSREGLNREKASRQIFETSRKSGICQISDNVTVSTLFLSISSTKYVTKILHHQINLVYTHSASNSSTMSALIFVLRSTLSLRCCSSFTGPEEVEEEEEASFKWFSVFLPSCEAGGEKLSYPRGEGGWNEKRRKN